MVVEYTVSTAPTAEAREDLDIFEVFFVDGEINYQVFADAFKPLPLLVTKLLSRRYIVKGALNALGRRRCETRVVSS